MKAIELTELSKRYGKARGIERVSLSVEEGAFFGFIGPNGAGKSTTIRILTGLISADSGCARVFGKDAGKAKREVLAQVGYLPSEAVFYHGMRVREVLRLSAELRGVDCTSEAARLCERLELDAGRKVDELSFGNRKKVGIVCALQHRPKLCILDEPTSGLDPLMQHAFFEILKERNEQGTTIFLSSHVLSEIQRYCTRAAIIRERRIIACDSVEALAKANAKRVTVQGAINVDDLQGVRHFQSAEGGVSFLYNGDMSALLSLLSHSPISDVTIAEPDLEEIFMHFYTDGGDEQ